MTRELKIGELARQAGVNIETIRYYERRKLLGPASRLPSGYRLYNRHSERRLRFIKNAQALGFTLHEIDALLDLQGSAKAPCGEVQQTAEAKLQHVEATVREMQSLATALRRMIGTCRDGRPCPILQRLEEDKARTARATRRKQASCFLPALR